MQHESEGTLRDATPRWATIFEVAEYLRVATRTVRGWTSSGFLASHGPKGAKRWDLNEVDTAMRGVHSPRK